MSADEADRMIALLKQHGSVSGKLRAQLWAALRSNAAVDLGLQGCAEAFLDVTARLLYATGLELPAALAKLEAVWREAQAEAVLPKPIAPEPGSDVWKRQLMAGDWHTDESDSE